MKNLYGHISIMLGNVKDKKHLRKTLLVEWNSLTPKMTFSLAQIGVNRYFLSLPIESDQFIFSLSNRK